MDLRRARVLAPGRRGPGRMIEYRDYMQDERRASSLFGGRSATQVLLLAHIGIFAAFVTLVWIVLPWVVRVELGAEQMARWTHETFGLVPTRALGDLWLWQFATWGFLNDPRRPIAFIITLWALWSIGREIEDLYGTRRFLAVYFISSLSGALTYCLLFYEPSPISGATSAIYGILVLFAIHFPRQKIILFVFPLEAWVVVLVVMGLDLVLHVTSAGGGVGYLANLGGAAGGWAYHALEPRVERLLDRLERRMDRAERQSEEEIEARLDTLLEKIGRDGMDSLSKKERDFLKRASRHYQKKA
jgi:membrane associated rhomboid family serine protease